MSKNSYRLYLIILSVIILVTIFLLIYKGFSYYGAKFEERHLHQDHENLKPSGIIGHGLGIAGSLCLIIGIVAYMARKRYRALSRLGLLKHWLEFHIFLCTLGPILIFFHTSLKIGGLVAISFWSMVIVFFSGIIGRFIYIQIPHTIEGRELSLKEILEMRKEIADNIRNSHNLDEECYKILTDPVKKSVELYHKNPFVRFTKKYFDSWKSIRLVRHVLKKSKLPDTEYNKILSLTVENIKLKRKIEQLGTMQNLFKYWHVVHLPFALVMLIIMFIHVGIAVLFGYRWIF